MSRGLVKTSRYSPGNMTGQALEQLFVGRDLLMKKVFKRLKASALGREKHFILLVGPRGIGKTHFVSLTHHKLKSDASYADVQAQLKIAYLNEEEWGVASFLDLLVRILEALRSEQKDSNLSEGIERIYEAFKKGPDAALHVAESLLIDHVRGSSLLLVCENLSDLFEGLGEEGQKRWRAFIQEHPFWSILATTPSLFSGVQLQSSPFYNFFSIEPLQRLDFDTAMDLLRQRAELDGQPRLVAFLSTPTGRARVRAIHHLAGGNHRVYVILSDFLDEESLEGLINPFMRMADDLTPYYQDRMRQLSAQQRKIVELLCKESRPVMVKDVASRCLISPQVAAKQLGELARDRFVLSTKVGREAHYELAEPLMRICVDIKDNRTEHFRLFVDFLRHWFSTNELKTKLDLLERTDAGGRLLDKMHLAVAIQDHSLDANEPFLQNLDDEARKCLACDDFQGLVDAAPRLIKDKPDAFYYRILAQALSWLGRFEESLGVVEEGVFKYPNDCALYVRKADVLMELHRFEESLGATGRALEIRPDEPVILEAHTATLFVCDRFEEAIGCGLRVLQLKPGVVDVLVVIAHSLFKMGRVADAERYYRRYLSANDAEASAFMGLLVCLVVQNRHDEVVAFVKSNPALMRKDNFPFRDYGRSLVATGRNEEAIAQLDEAVRIDGFDCYAYVLKSAALLGQGRNSEMLDVAMRAFDVSRSFDERALIVEFLSRSGEVKTALALMDRGQSEKGESYLVSHVRVLIALCEYGKALAVVKNGMREPAVDLSLELLTVQALVGGESFEAALFMLDAVMRKYNFSLDEGSDELSEALAEMLWAEFYVRGPIAMAQQAVPLCVILEKSNCGEFLSAALSVLLGKLIATEKLAAGVWVDASVFLAEKLKERPYCSIPLAMLSAASKYKQNGDERALLELPLEQRTLLLEKLGVKQP